MTNRDKITEILYKNSFDTSEGLTIRFEKIESIIDKIEALSICEVNRSLPTKEEIIFEGEKQIVDWIEGNTENEKQHYRIAFRRSFEYVLRRLKSNG